MATPRPPGSLGAEVGHHSFWYHSLHTEIHFNPLGLCYSTASKGVGVPVVKPQHKPHQHRDSLAITMITASG
jgi:hypothetical protein